MTFLSVEDALSRAGGSLETAVSLLWHLDSNRLRPTTDYQLDLQERTEGYSHDAASSALVQHVNDDVWSRPTFCAFKKLLDNYTAETGVPEVVSQDERHEEDTFLTAICETPCIRYAYEWLAANSNMRCQSMGEFSEMLKRMWFDQYSRDGSRDSSGFEHVFCGEIDDGEVKGLHNFLQVFVEEARGNFNYKGYLDIRGEPCYQPPPANQQMVTIRFDWLGETKSVSSMFVGPSPEFEFAVYTMMYVACREELEVELGPYRTRLKVYQMAGKIGTAFPELLGVDHDKLAEDAVPESTGIDSNSPPPAASSFPPLGAPSHKVTQGFSYAAAVQNEDGGEQEEAEAPGTEQFAGEEAPALQAEDANPGEEEIGFGGEGEEGAPKDALKWIKLILNIAKKLNLFKSRK